jgi:hypothetical protein
MSISAKFLTCYVNGQEVVGTHEYNINERGDRIEATTGTDGGRGKKDVGVVDTMMRVMIYADATTFDPTGLKVGDTLLLLEFFTSPDENATPIYQIDEATIFETTFRGQIRDKFVWECDIEARGDTVTVNAL